MLRWAYQLIRLYLFIFRPLGLGVRTMLIRDGQVVLVRHTYIDGWYMPGGGVHRNETLETAARREALEEAGAELADLELVGAYSNFTQWMSDHNILFLSTRFTLSGRHDREIAEVRSFPLDALPDDLWPGHRRRLEEYRAGKPSPRFGQW